MGGAVSSVGNAVGNVVGGVGGAVNSVVQQVPGIGPVLGPAAGIALGQNPISAFGSSLTTNLFNSGGGGGGGGQPGGSSAPTYAQPNFNYGNNTYQYGDARIKADPYFITGDKGVYNLLPALGQINAGTNQTKYFPSSFGRDPTRATERFNRIGAQGAYTPYEAYQDIQAQMANDPTALAAFNKAFSPTTFNAPRISLPGGHGIPVGPSTNSPMGQFYANTPNPYGNQFVNFGLNRAIPNQTGLNYNKLADYAAENKNPFFLPFQTTQGATPLGFTPSASALAPIDTTSYLSGYGTANTAQQQFIRDQQQAARDAERAREEARRAQRIEQRNQRDVGRDQIEAAERAREQARDAQRDQRNINRSPPPSNLTGGLAALRRR